MGSKEKVGGSAPTNSSVTPAEKALVRDLRLAAAPDVNKAFADTKDACSRLLPFHVFSDRQPSYSLKYSQAVAEAYMLVSLVKGKLSTDSESAHAAASTALAKYPRWLNPPAENGGRGGLGAVDEEALARRKTEEDLETRRETHLGVQMRKLEESREISSGVFHARERGNLRGEEQVMIAKWLLEDERKQLIQAQQREAEREAEKEALRREVLLVEAQEREALIREARERSAQQQAAQAAQVAQAAQAAQKAKAAQAAQLLAAREAAALIGGREASETPEGKGVRPAAGAPHWLTGDAAQRSGPPKRASMESGERETTDLLSHFALNQAMGAQEVDAVGGLSNPPMSTEDLLSWQEADAPRDMPADWLGGAGLMDLNLDVPVVGDPGGGALGNPTKKRPREDDDDVLLP